MDSRWRRVRAGRSWVEPVGARKVRYVERAALAQRGQTKRLAHAFPEVLFGLAGGLRVFLAFAKVVGCRQIILIREPRRLQGDLKFRRLFVGGFVLGIGQGLEAHLSGAEAGEEMVGHLIDDTDETGAPVAVLEVDQPVALRDVDQFGPQAFDRRALKTLC